MKLLLKGFVIVEQLENVDSRKYEFLSSNLGILNEQDQEREPQFLLLEDVLGEELSVCVIS